MDDEQITEPIVPDAALDPPMVTEASHPTEPVGNLNPTLTTLNPTPEPSTDEISPPPVVVDEVIPEPPAVEPFVVTEPPQPSATAPNPIPDTIPDLQPILTPKPSTLNPIPAPAPEPQLHPDASTLTSIPQPLTSTFDVAILSDEQLKAAAALYTKRNQAEISRKGVAKRQETMELNLREIVDFLSLNNGSPLPRIAKHTNITLGTTSKYLRQLNAKGKIRAEGWGKNRRYFLR